jgi:hypothetical protein
VLHGDSWLLEGERDGKHFAVDPGEPVPGVFIEACRAVAVAANAEAAIPSVWGDIPKGSGGGDLPDVDR